MKSYDRHEPLIAIHIPKTGGVSVRQAFKGWFGSNLYLNYYNEVAGTMPERLEWNRLLAESNPVCIYGHFNSRRGFGIRDYYPEARQFVAIMRDPFESAMSSFFFLNRVIDRWNDRSIHPGNDLHQYLDKYIPNILNHFPFEVTAENYRDLIEQHFIFLGISESMETSLELLAMKLGFSPPDKVEHHNKSVRNLPIPEDLKDKFREQWPLEYAVYEYAKETLAQNSALHHAALNTK